MQLAAGCVSRAHAAWDVGLAACCIILFFFAAWWWLWNNCNQALFLHILLAFGHDFVGCLAVGAKNFFSGARCARAKALSFL